MTHGNEAVPQNDFYCVLEGDGVFGNTATNIPEVQFGTAVRLTFCIPALAVTPHEISFGLSVHPYGLRYLGKIEHEWYRLIHVPCEETEVNFDFIAPTEEEWKSSLTPGFAVVLDTEGLINYQDFLRIQFISGKKRLVKKLGFDLAKDIQGMTDRALEWRGTLERIHRSHEEIK
ncbi:MAG: hypothetical protein WCT49_01650 [Candidatus Paceibacterota bacterium]|jgi:hypothetical protein|nr:hypothetical protein [Candidatus Paceibacterota bacterium]